MPIRDLARHRRQIGFRLFESQRKMLVALARTLKDEAGKSLSQSEVVRRAIEEFYTRNKKRK